MTALLLSLSLTLGASDALAKTQLEGLSVSTPKAWSSEDAAGSAGTDDGLSKTWEEPKGEEAMRAKLELTVWTMVPGPADACVQKVKAALEAGDKLPDGGVGPPKAHFDKVKVAGQPAIRNVVFDFVGGDDKAKVEKNKVSTVTYVGCDGTTRWLLTMTSPKAQSPRFGALLKKIIDSMKYEAAGK